ncbi:MAG: hypothetical protein HY898_22395 [Deltaproteobacteria bacterium]|nr:hypothetical protein [Deltaproteobacteria bacterium]
MRASRLTASFVAASIVVSASADAFAGDFDPQGNFAFDPSALVREGFETLVEYGPGDADGGEVGIKGLVPLEAPDAIEGKRVALVQPENWWEYAIVPVQLPAKQLSVRARLWTRHQNVVAMFVARFNSSASAELITDLMPTGRCTSDGWVELQSAPLSIDGLDLSAAALAVRGGGEIDGFELVEDGVFRAQEACAGAFDTVCGPEGICLAGRCRDGASLVPPLPAAGEREKVVDWLESRVRFLFGGRWTRQHYLPLALEEIERMRQATGAWSFWNGFATAVHKLHDWHTSLSGIVMAVESPRHLNLCFLEGYADLSHKQWPSDPQHLDILVAYTGSNRTLGLKRGDRLLAVDGIHPISWARSLAGVSWDFWQADDDSSNAEFVERMRGLIPMFARNFTVLRCDEASASCADTPEVIDVSSIPEDLPSDGDTVGCDNRPAYHLDIANPPSAETHRDVSYNIFLGPVVDAQPGENIWGMTWDLLWGPTMTPQFLKLGKTFADNQVRGVILDHRAGSGGTIDAAEAITRLAREPLDLAIFPFWRPTAGFEGPADAAEGLAIFNRYKVYTNDPDGPQKVQPDLTYTVGSKTADAQLPIAMLIHRDGSASDYLPYGLKGAPKVRIFGPHATAGAFSSFFNLNFWGNLSMQVATGDTISNDGGAHIGHGVQPDEVVLPLQSDLIHGKDTIYERALQWVRSELKP